MSLKFIALITKLPTWNFKDTDHRFHKQISVGQHCFVWLLRANLGNRTILFCYMFIANTDACSRFEMNTICEASKILYLKWYGKQ